MPFVYKVEYLTEKKKKKKKENSALGTVQCPIAFLFIFICDESGDHPALQWGKTQATSSRAQTKLKR